MNNPPDATLRLSSDIRQLIESARQRVAVVINAELTQLYWHIGRRINDDLLQGKRAGYGQEVVKSLATELTSHYGKGWGEKHLRHCMHFAEIFTEEAIVYTLCRQFSWSHLRLLIFMEDPLQRTFYAEMCRLEKWSVRQLRERIQSMLYERTAISRRPEITIQNDLEKLREENKISPDLVFRDPYMLDFLGLSDTFSEKDMESAILAELQRFIIEIGQDFAFLARQKRIVIDNRDYRIDLLFYHRRLKCLIVIDLKLGEFEAGYKGQMELYLRYLEKHDTVEGEALPIGLILCAGKNEEHIELLQLHKSNIRVAEYLTQLPPKQLLQDKLHQSIEIARRKLSQKEEDV